MWCADGAASQPDGRSMAGVCSMHASARRSHSTFCCPHLHANLAQVADLEAAAGEVVLLESRAEAAEGERDEALEQLRAATPRPPQSWGELLELVGEAGAAVDGREGGLWGGQQDSGLCACSCAVYQLDHSPGRRFLLTLIGASPFFLPYSHVPQACSASRPPWVRTSTGPPMSWPRCWSALPCTARQLRREPPLQKPCPSHPQQRAARQPHPQSQAPPVRRSPAAAEVGRATCESTLRPAWAACGLPSAGGNSLGRRCCRWVGEVGWGGVGAGWWLKERLQCVFRCRQVPRWISHLHRPTQTTLAAVQAVEECNATLLQEAAGEEYAAWLAQALSRPAAASDALADFLVGSSRSGLPLHPAVYGCMHQYKEVRQEYGAALLDLLPPMHSISRHMQQPTIPSLLSTLQGITFDEVRSAVQRVRMSTRTRVAALEEEVGGWVVSIGCCGQWILFCIVQLALACTLHSIIACSPLHPWGLTWCHQTLCSCGHSGRRLASCKPLCRATATPSSGYVGRDRGCGGSLIRLGHPACLGM